MLIAKMTTQPDARRKRSIDTCIKALIGCGAWPLFSMFYMPAAHAAQAATLNWVNPGQRTLTYPATAPNFDADRGLTGNGVDAWGNTNVAYSALTKFSTNSAHLGFYTLLDIAEAASPVATSGSALTLVRPRTTGTTFAGRMNDATTANYTSQATAIGHFGMNRSAADAREWYADGVQVKSDATTVATGLSTGNAALLRENAAYSTNQVACAHWGASMTAAQWASVRAAIRAYLVDVGAVA